MFHKVKKCLLSYVDVLRVFTLTRYRKKVSLYNGRVEELNSVTRERDDIKKQYDEWRKKRLDLPITYYTASGIYGLYSY